LCRALAVPFLQRGKAAASAWHDACTDRSGIGLREDIVTVSMSVVQQGALRVAATTGQSRASEKGKARGGSENTPAALARSAPAAQTARNGQSFGRLVSGYARDISETVQTGSVQTGSVQTGTIPADSGNAAAQTNTI
jgi:hypothetical protein